MTASPMRRAYGVKILNASHPDVRRLKRDGHVAEIHGNKFWNSSFLIMDYLKRHPLAPGQRVLEIGCGWGLLSVFCAREFGCDVVATDADANVLPYAALHAEINDVTVTTERKTFQQLSTAWLRDFDVILGADICFWDEMTPMLYNLVRRAGRAGVGSVMIADPCRSPFTALAERCEARLPAVAVVAKAIRKPVAASGEILIVRS